jgi:hypothetical protein
MFILNPHPVNYGSTWRKPMIFGRELTGIARLVFTGDLAHNHNYEIVRTLILSVHLYFLEYVEIIGKPPKELNGKEEMSLPPAISPQLILEMLIFQLLVLSRRIRVGP